MAANDLTRCPGSNQPPARVWRERSFCRCCGQGFAIKADGTVRRHADPAQAFVPVSEQRPALEEREAVEIVAAVLRGNYPLAEAVLAALVEEGIVDELELPDHMRQAVDPADMESGTELPD